MKINKFLLVFSFLIAMISILPAFSQATSFSDPNVDYTFDLPNPTWRITLKPSATSPNVEYVFGQKVNGHLDVRVLAVQKNELISEVVRREEPKIRFKKGYVGGKEENFKGLFLKGTVLNFEYLDNTNKMSGRYYFLRANDTDTSVYLLRFTGLKDSLQSLLNQTDSIARSFKVKPTGN